jgi:hypothetical protein
VSANGGVTAGSPPRAWVSLGVKINRGNYQSLDVSLGLSQDLADGVTPEEGFDRLFEVAADQLTEKVNAMLLAYPIAQ